MAEPAQDVTPPYRYGIDDLGDAPLGAENALDRPEGVAAADPLRSEGEFRKAVIELLTEIRDALAADSEG